MSSDFDPYYLWLGIPPHEQPPNHYRLLGITLFESNNSVIDSAASRQSTYLHSVATGPQRQASQKLLTEIAGARRTLLNAESKQAYDAELKTRREPPAPLPVTPPIARPVAVAIPVAAPIAAPVAAPIAAPVAAPITAPVAAPIAAPVAAPITAPVAAPIAAPVAAPIAAPVAAPIAAPVAAPDAIPFDMNFATTESEPLADLFGGMEDESNRELAPASQTIAPAAELKSSVSPTAARLSKQQMGIAGVIAGLVVVILAFVFRPRGDEEENPDPPQKTSTPKKSKTSATAKSKSVESKPAESPNSAPLPTGKRQVRYIRIELPRKGVVALAEVEALYDGRNVAAYGATAEQSTTEGGAVAPLAVDGKTSGKSSDKTHSQTKDTDKPWWHLDLGGAYPLETIVIHNRTDPGMGEKMAGFTLILMDKYSRPIVEVRDLPAPNPRSEFAVNSLVSSPPASAKPEPTKAKPAESKKPEKKPAAKAKAPAK